MFTKRNILVMIALLLVASLVFAGGSSDTDGKKVFKLSFNQTMENPEAMTMVDFSKQLEEATGGRYAIEVYPSEQLGAQQQSLELVQSGAIEMAIVANPLVEAINPDFSIIGTPYVYDSIEHQEKLFASGKLDTLFATTEDAGFKVLAAYSLGARNLYGTEGLVNPQELSGKKIRVMQSDTMIQMINTMGGVGTPMGQGDVYSAIQSGTLDGAENNIITYVDLLQYEVAPHYTESGHLMVPDLLIINTKVFEAMSAEDQAAMMEIAQASVEIMFDYAEDLRETYYKKAQDELGVTIHTIDITPFQNNMKPFIEEVANKSEMSKEVYEAILATR